MRRLTRVREREQGAIAMIVAMLFGFSVMLAVGALTVDVGNINADRRQLQNGADAVALAVAQQCVAAADGKCDVGSTKIDTLKELANANAADGATAIQRVDLGTPLLASGIAAPLGTPAICGTADGLPKCPDSWVASTSNLQECPTPSTALPTTVKYVRVYTETAMKKADGTHNNILPYYFGAAITGTSGANQQACASVGIGPLGSSPKGLPIVIAECAYKAMKDKGPLLSPPLPSFPPVMPDNIAVQTTPQLLPSVYAPYVTKILTHTTNPPGSGPPVNDPMKCDKSTSGLYLAGGFGWTATVDGTHCSSNFTSDTGTWTMPVNNGAAAPDGCKANSGSSSGTSPKTFVGTTTYIPIMTGISGSNYIINGLAGFYVAGYRVPGDDYNGYTGTDALTISGSDVGFWGWFTDKYEDTGSFGTTTDPTVPKVIGTIG